MADCIEREAALDFVNGWHDRLIPTYGENDEYVKCLEAVAKNLGAIPAADKVAESVRSAVADSMKKADKNGDGVLSEEEVRDLFPPPPRGERGRRGRGPGQRPER